MGTESVTSRPSWAWRGVNGNLVASTSPREASPRKASRMRSTTRPADGKSIAISSAKQFCDTIRTIRTGAAGVKVVLVSRSRYGDGQRVPAGRRNDAAASKQEHHADSRRVKAERADEPRVGLPGMRLL